MCEEDGRKILLFTEWTSMLDAVEPILKRLQAGFVRLDGSVPPKKRRALVRTFQENPSCRVFLTTNAGSTGLNLQAPGPPTTRRMPSASSAASSIPMPEVR